MIIDLYKWHCLIILKVKVMLDNVRAVGKSFIMLGRFQRLSPRRMREKTLSRAQITVS
jgi:hypothetical protein